MTIAPMRRVIGMLRGPAVLDRYPAARTAYINMLRLSGLPPPTHADDLSRRAWERLQVLKDY